jgi:hypothetical protein
LSHRRNILGAPSARIDAARGDDFVTRINAHLASKPRLSTGNPQLVSRLLDEYYGSLNDENPFLYRLGHAAAHLLQGQRIARGDKLGGSLTDNEVFESVARSVARIINERRAAASEVASEPDSPES